MPKKIEMPEEELRGFIESGMTEKEIADHYGCAEITVKKRKQEYGLTSPRGKQALDKKIQDYIMENMESVFTEKVYNKIEAIKTQSQIKSELSDSISIIIKDGIKYEIEGNSLILYNISGDCGIAASEIKSMSTGISLDLNGYIGVLELIVGGRCLAAINPIVNHGDEIVVAVANYHTIDSYLIENKTPIAKLSVINKQDVNWIQQ
jgi:hypothetical protein